MPGREELGAWWDGVDPDRARMLAHGGPEKDPVGLVAEINRRAGCELTLVGVAEHGVCGGAVYVRWPDGRDGVVTRSPAPMVRMQQTVDVLAEARAAGLPVPAPRSDRRAGRRGCPGSGAVAGCTCRRPGRCRVIDAMVAMNERFAGLLADHPQVPIQPMCLQRGGYGRAKHQLLQNHDGRSRRLLRRIYQIGETEPHEMCGVDLVHPDYTFGNILYDDHGRLSGVVDWNWGIGRGDRHLALVRIYIDLFWGTLNPGKGHRAAFARLDEIVQQLIEPNRLRMYWAHITLEQLSSWIHQGRTEAIALFQRFGEYRLDF